MLSPEQHDIWAHHIWPTSAAGEGGNLCPTLPRDVAAFTLHSVRDRLSAMQAGQGVEPSPPLTVVEVYVHTIKLREQLRVLAQMCRCAVSPQETLSQQEEAAREQEDGAGSGSGGPGMEKATAAEVESESDTNSKPLSIADSRKLLGDLYMRVERADGDGAAVWRTLLRRSLQPYLDALGSAIFLAQVEDYHDEFLLRHDKAVAERCAEHYLHAFTLRAESECPFFLVAVRTQILRTVQGLAVLRACKPDDALTAIQEPPSLELRYSVAAVRDLEAEHAAFHRTISEKAERAALAQRRAVLLDEHTQRVAFRERIQGLVEQYRALELGEKQALRGVKVAQQQERDALQQQALADQARKQALDRSLRALVGSFCGWELLCSLPCHAPIISLGLGPAQGRKCACGPCLIQQGGCACLGCDAREQADLS
jgi:hypothetical protein